VALAGSERFIIPYTRVVGRTHRRVLLGDPCSYCGGPGGTIDHIVPRCQGGENFYENMTSACARCNGRKSDKPLLTFLLES
jgi:5-methylcytosine-specific restriction endonuclease McrA